MFVERRRYQQEPNRFFRGMVFSLPLALLIWLVVIAVVALALPPRQPDPIPPPAIGSPADIPLHGVVPDDPRNGTE